MTIRIFQVNDMEWWAGEGSPEDTLAAYMAETGVSHEDATGDEDDMPEVLSDASMDAMRILNADEDGNPTGGDLSFKEHLANLVAQGTKFPCFFAGRE